ncbi:MAG: Na(+)/H(+) antiporter subunit B [Candidatus Cloacimonadaceae bacterium]|nr:Na(+)/H(+) antiporter subunit B [Candidatus Cloacimonadaceae bacterium]MDP3114347.1 Na(+)/H(+) antiporter subunit B [Candidatus Cloacimonadaceae bacterium]
MIKYLFIFLALAGLAWILFPLVADFSTAERLNPLASEYVRGSTADLNMPNAVTAVVVSYRGLDTLGEVTVLFLATMGIGYFLKRRNKKGNSRTEGSEILQTGAKFLTPLIVVLGIYIFTHGHLSPGGGFQGGVVIASAILMIGVAEINFRLSHLVLHVSESISGIAYVGMGLAGLVILGADHFLDPRYLLEGRFLALFSAGAVPIIYSLIGVKVGSELASVLSSIQDEGDET